MMPLSQSRRLSIGAEPDEGGASFRVWAPAVSRVDVVLVESAERPDRATASERTAALDAEDDGHFSGWVDGVRAGDLYMLRLDADRLRPDPASRFQPAGPHGASMVVTPTAFGWHTERWPAPGSRADVVYEMHVGTFTRPGTWEAAIAQLPRLAELGITLLEVMPVGEFTGAFGWGYDGVYLFAPHHTYGTPDDMRRFVDTAHGLGLGVVLDVVYNHFGPDGCYLRDFSPDYFSTRHEGQWGDPLNFDDVHSEGMRELVTANARYWVEEFRVDGLRLDATQAIIDGSPSHIVRELIAAARGATHRRLWVVAENEPQESALVRPIEDAGHGGDALWNDDFHHAAVVALTGRREAYYTDYEGAPQEFVSAAKYGYLYQGQYYSWQKRLRGTYSLDLTARHFVCCLENHDQVANSLYGERLWRQSSPGAFRAMTSLLLLGPWIPMLFQGQEWGSERPFLFFADMPAGLREAVAAGRRTFLAQFPGCAAHQSEIADPGSRDTFERSRLGEPVDGPFLRLHRDLIRLRQHEPAFRAPASVDGAVIGPAAFVLRYCGDEPIADRLLFVNLGSTLEHPLRAEPLLAPPSGARWTQLWDSERAEYGGAGTRELDLAGPTSLGGQAAVVMGAGRRA